LANNVEVSVEQAASPHFGSQQCSEMLEVTQMELGIEVTDY
jgi:hypothetical protein